MIEKRGRKFTGPVNTLRDLVVHVPANSGSTCAAANEKKVAAPRASNNNENDMKEGGKSKAI